ncbi:MAG: hypothetical protein BGO90_10825 [Legionella sp. 40-6]|nr:hypothetical protein [Legionella sp.]OJY46815.1 MAG: hypothetical protein BGO90_10825 [Legionella sp. 40-6]
MTNKSKLTSQELFNRMIEGIVVQAKYWLKDEIYPVFVGLERSKIIIEARNQFSKGLYKLCEDFFKKIKLPGLSDEFLLWFIGSFYSGQKFILTHFLEQLNTELKNHNLYFTYRGDVSLVHQCFQPLTYDMKMLTEPMRMPSSHNLRELDKSDDPFADEDKFLIEEIEIQVQFFKPLEKAMCSTLEALGGKYFVSHYQVKKESLEAKITQYAEYFEQKKWDNAFESVIDFVIQASIVRKGLLNFFPASFGSTHSATVFFKSLDTYCRERDFPEQSVTDIMDLLKNRIKNATKAQKTNFSVT